MKPINLGDYKFLSDYKGAEIATCKTVKGQHLVIFEGNKHIVHGKHCRYECVKFIDALIFSNQMKNNINIYRNI